jgi:hypothetical protein
VSARGLVVAYGDRIAVDVEPFERQDLVAQALARCDRALVAGERPAIHRLAGDVEPLREPFRTLAAVQLDRVDAIEELRVRIHRSQHVAAFLDDAVHVHAVFDRRDAEVRHAVEPPAAWASPSPVWICIVAMCTDIMAVVHARSRLMPTT